MQSYNKAYEFSLCAENRKPIHTGKLNMPKRQEHILCCTMKGKSDKTGMVENRNLEIDGIGREEWKRKVPQNTKRI
jgi:hypothetical protein